MVLTKSSKGGLVNVEVKGIAEVQRMLMRKGKLLGVHVGVGLARAGNFVQSEVQESVIGRRSEPKSVRTGLFGNNIDIKFGKNSAIIYPNNSRYPNGQTVAQVAKLLEHGTSRVRARRHFRNTKNRTADKVRKILNSEVRKAL